MVKLSSNLLYKNRVPISIILTSAQLSASIWNIKYHSGMLVSTAWTPWKNSLAFSPTQYELPNMRAQKQQIKLTTRQSKVNSLFCKFKMESQCNDMVKIAKYITLTCRVAANFLFIAWIYCLKQAFSKKLKLSKSGKHFQILLKCLNCVNINLYTDHFKAGSCKFSWSVKTEVLPLFMRSKNM